MDQSFLPAGYEQPRSGGGYTELKLGENKLRVLSTPLMIWLEWRDGKPIRHPYFNAQNQPTEKPVKGSGQKDSVKHAWNMVVWNYDTKQIEIFECDKQDVIAALLNLSRQEVWGHPKKYDIVIKKSGSGMDTEYHTTPNPPSEPANEIVEAFVDTPIDLNQLLVPNGNPFLAKASAANPANANTQPQQAAGKVVTPENWAPGDPAPNGYIVAPGDGTIPDGYQASDFPGLLKKKLPF